MAVIMMSGPGMLIVSLHGSTHEAGGTDEIDISGLTPGVHHTRHESGGADELDISGLTPALHASRHQLAGADLMNVAGLAGLLADLQSVLDHTHQSAGLGVGGKLDHGAALDGLLDDDHAQYILVAGTRAFTGDQAMGNHKITGLATPTAATDAATKGYADGAAPGQRMVGGWVNLNGTGTIAINDSYNVSSIVDEGTGRYTVTWNTDFANAYYACVSSGAQYHHATSAYAVGSVRVDTNSNDHVGVDTNPVSCIAIGDITL